MDVNRFTKVQFDFTLVQETEGHAICFDEDTNLDSKFVCANDFYIA